MARYKMYTGVPKIIINMKSNWFTLKEITDVTKLGRQSIYNFLGWKSKTRKLDWVSIRKVKELIEKKALQLDILKNMLWVPRKNKEALLELWIIENDLFAWSSQNIKELIQKKNKLLRQLNWE